ncbi:FAD assembly factor SdhE [Oryzibacter oryziterrae]|uniref:FAD assembly factor SdhE n=1 Tax=Oryzibacter oryziterrae TaxID=2766474 RepID=UPI001F1C42B9|nr:succinate dehydrogenase assembly factor 2 [Oryzibacter oryziterrae]
MSGLSRTSDDLSPRRRRILYHAWHRGTRELDLLLGRFADAHVGDLLEAELDDFEALMEVEDKDLFGWILGKQETPEQFRTAVLAKVLAYAAAHPLTD